jgi:hypothetical protein
MPCSSDDLDRVRQITLTEEDTCPEPLDEMNFGPGGWAARPDTPAMSNAASPARRRNPGILMDELRAYSSAWSCQ